MSGTVSQGLVCLPTWWGADDVRMFKGDQIRDDIEIRVTLWPRPRRLMSCSTSEFRHLIGWRAILFVRVIASDSIWGPGRHKTGDQYENGLGPEKALIASPSFGVAEILRKEAIF